MSSSLYKNRTSSFFPKLDLFFPEKKMIKSSSNKNIIIKNKYSLSFTLNKKEKTKIIWFEGGKKIFLTGSFCNWDKLYLMKKNNKDKYFYYSLDLPKGFYQFKFKVDGKWKNSSFYPKLNNHGNINNYLDNTSSNYEFASLSTNESSIISSPLNNKNNNNYNKIINNINVNNNIDFSYCTKNYCIYYPKIKEMREYTNKKPTNFQIECYHGINQIQNSIGNKKYLFLEENDIFSGNYTYKNIERKDHILLNHLCQKQKKKNKNNVLTSIVIKYRRKNCTFLYYK